MGDRPDFEYDQHAFCTNTDPAPLLAALEHYASAVSRGIALSPLVLEPEPAGVRKRRFRSDVEDLTGYVAQFHFEPMADGSVAGAIALDTPEPKTADEVRSALTRPSGVGLPTGWTLDADLLDADIIALNNPTVTDATSGPWAIEALLALGTSVPTGRWRFILPTIPRGDATI